MERFLYNSGRKITERGRGSSPSLMKEEVLFTDLNINQNKWRLLIK